jgi:hypothetical protein
MRNIARGVWSRGRTALGEVLYCLLDHTPRAKCCIVLLTTLLILILGWVKGVVLMFNGKNVWYS